jgi:hypothetical protein
MAKRNVMNAKLHAANVREGKVINREPRDDGIRRRSHTDALTVAEDRERSRERKFYVGRYQRAKMEAFARWYLLRTQGPDAVAWRESLVGPLECKMR